MKNNFLITAAASMVSAHNRKKTISKIKNVNEANRNIHNIGQVSPDAIIPENTFHGNLCITGGTDEVRNSLLIQNCKQSLAQGVPTIVIHEGNYHLEYEIKRLFLGKCYCRITNKGDSSYEPIYRLDTDEQALLIREASREDELIGTDGNLYIRALSDICNAKGIPSYMRMLASFPFNSAQTIIAQLENGGKISHDEALRIRNDLMSGAVERSKIEQYFTKLTAEGDIIAWKDNLGRSTSISECIRNKGVLIIDIGTNAKKTLMSTIRAEIMKCINEGKSFRVIFDSATMAQNPLLLDLLSKSYSSFFWTLSSADLNVMVNAGGKLTSWIALSHKLVMFANSLGTAQALSSELGEYDFIDVVNSHAGNTDFGNFGLHFGVNDNIQTSNRREKVIKAEEITMLKEKEFFLLDNNCSELLRGVVA